jgi:hypothetical protein
MQFSSVAKYGVGENCSTALLFTIVMYVGLFIHPMFRAKYKEIVVGVFQSSSSKLPGTRVKSTFLGFNEIMKSVYME